MYCIKELSYLSLIKKTAINIMKGQGGGGIAKGGGKSKSAASSIAIKQTKERQTKDINEHIITLRSAIFDEMGKDKDVTKDIAPSFMKYDRNGLDVSIEFATRLSKDETEWAFELVKDTMEERYDSSGYGWDDEDKMEELSEKGARFLLVREWPVDNAIKGDLIGFVHFRFTVQGEVMDKMAGEPSLYVFDIHIEEHSQRKGLGKHLLLILELIARKEKMRMISIPVQLNDEFTLTWLTLKTGRGYVKDEYLDKLGFDPMNEGFEIYVKPFEDIKKKALNPPKATSIDPATNIFQPTINQIMKSTLDNDITIVDKENLNYSSDNHSNVIGTSIQSKDVVVIHNEKEEGIDKKDVTIEKVVNDMKSLDIQASSSTTTVSHV